MSLVFVYSTISFYILTILTAAEGYTYQTEPLVLPFPDFTTAEAVTHYTHPAANRLDDALEVKCHEDSIEVVVRTPVPDNALSVESAWLGLYSEPWELCAAATTPPVAGPLVIRAPLSECGSKMMFTKTAVLFSNLLLLSLTPSSPTSSEKALWRQEAVVPVLCQYKRRYTVSSGELRPTWTPHISVQSAHLHLNFQLRLMTSDWSSERSYPVYLMGETVNIEASMDHSDPSLRLYVSSCVATLTPDVTSHPRYPFIDHQGCFTDSQLSGSSSRFLPRVQDQLLHIQLEPFLFHEDHRQHIYITCELQAAPVLKKSSETKACSFSRGRWRSVDGDDHVCESCGSFGDAAASGSAKHNHKEELKSESSETGLHGETAVGPLIFVSQQETYGDR